MLIRTPKNITKGQLALVVILGVFGGFYVWRPIFLSFQEKNKPASEKEEVLGEPLKEK